MSPPQSSSPTNSTELVVQHNLRQLVFSKILTAVFEGRFQSGQRLVMQGLADRYGVSPTPVREALLELQGLGVVDLLPNRGAVVRAFGPAEVREICQIRRVLEVEATRCACGQADPGELSELEAELARLSDIPPSAQWDRDARAADTWLHGLIANACGSARLKSEICRYQSLFQALRDVSHARDAGTNYSRSNDTLEHLAIVRTLVTQNPEGAALAMDAHIRSAARYLEAVFFGDVPKAASKSG